MWAESWRSGVEEAGENQIEFVGGASEKFMGEMNENGFSKGFESKDQQSRSVNLTVNTWSCEEHQMLSAKGNRFQTQSGIFLSWPLHAWLREPAHSNSCTADMRESSLITEFTLAALWHLYNRWLQPLIFTFYFLYPWFTFSGRRWSFSKVRIATYHME